MEKCKNCGHGISSQKQKTLSGKPVPRLHRRSSEFVMIEELICNRATDEPQCGKENHLGELYPEHSGYCYFCKCDKPEPMVIMIKNNKRAYKT